MKEVIQRLGQSQTLLSILTRPETPPSPQTPAVLFLNAGLIHHVGPNRLYVRLARRLAQAGIPACRFDLSGVGDSQVRTDSTPFEQSILQDTQQVMNHLQNTEGYQRFILIGHCSGGIISLGMAAQDPRVCGVVMINAEGGDSEWDDYDLKRKTSQYYETYYSQEALSDPEKWKKFLTGRAHYGNIIRNVFQNILWNKISALRFKTQQQLSTEKPKVRPEVEMIFSSIPDLLSRQTQILMLYSEGSTGLERTQLIMRDFQHIIRDHPAFTLELLSNRDHSFTPLASQKRLIDRIQTWCTSL